MAICGLIMASTAVPWITSGGSLAWLWMLPLSPYVNIARPASVMLIKWAGGELLHSFGGVTIILMIAQAVAALDVIAGLMAHRLGAKGTIILGLAISAITYTYLAQPGRPAPWYLLIGGLVVGGALCGWVPVMSVLSRRFPNHRTLAASAALIISGGLIPHVTGGGGTPVTLGLKAWQINGLIAGITAALAAGAYLTVRSGTARTGGTENQRTGILCNHAFWLLIAGEGIALTAMLTVIDISGWTEMVLGRPTRETVVAYKWTTAVPSAGFVAAALSAGRLPKMQAIAAFALVQAAATAALAAPEGAGLQYPAAALAVGAMSAQLPLAIALIAELVEEKQYAKALGIFSGGTATISLIGMLLLSLWKVPVGFRGTQPSEEWQYVVVTATLALTAAIVLAATGRNRKGGLAPTGP